MSFKQRSEIFTFAVLKSSLAAAVYKIDQSSTQMELVFSSTLVRIKTKQYWGSNLSRRRKRGPSQIYNCLEITQSIISSEKSEG